MADRSLKWTIARGREFDPAPFCILAVINVTPDSFFDGGEYLSPEQGLARCGQAVEQGARILDIGGESSRPFAEPVSAEDEQARVLPVLKGAVELVNSREHRDKGLAVSVDTYKASTAMKALESGADIINDISACRFDPELMDVLGQYQPGYVLMHSQGRPEDMQKAPEYDDPVAEIRAFFEERMNALTRTGLPEDRIVLDPGIGFGKRLEHNLAILRHLESFQDLGRPVLVGLSNKSLWGDLLGLGPEERGNATQAGTALAAAKGALLHRVHDVALTAQTLAVVSAIC